MNTIPIDSILIPEDRQRKDFDPEALAELRTSIFENELIHALVLQPDGKTLVAGERRLRALLEDESDWTLVYNGETLTPRHVPFTTTSSSDPLSLAAIELEENIRRVDLNWQERSDAEAKLHKIRIEQHGEYDPKSNPNGWSIAKTAKEVDPKSKGSGRAHKELAENLELAKHLDDPEIAKIKDKREALKAVRNKKKTLERASLNLEAFDQDDDFQLYIGDVIDELSKLPDESIDVFLSDPPYGRNFHHDKLWSGQRRDFNDSPKAYRALMEELLPLLGKKLKPQAHVYLFCDIFHFDWLRSELMLAGVKPWRHPIIWDKAHMGSYAEIDYGPRHCYDYVLFGNKGKREMAKHDRDVISGILPVEEKDHPDAKPPELFRNLLLRSAHPGDHVVDGFAGAGTIFRAARGLSLKVSAIEQDEQWRGTINRAMVESSSNPGDLF
jgi:DNA modification methylase